MSLPKRHVSALVLLLGLCCLTFASCGSVTVRKFRPDLPEPDVTYAEEANYTKGIVFYAPWPYLLVSPVSGGKQTATIVMLPDRTRPRILEWKSGWFGSTQAKVGFTDGWNLTSLDSKVESGLSGAITAIAGALPGAESVSLQPGLYKLKWNKADKKWEGPAAD